MRFFCRNNEYYLRCTNFDILENILKENNLNYDIHKNENLYLIYAK